MARSILEGRYQAFEAYLGGEEEELLSLPPAEADNQGSMTPILPIPPAVFLPSPAAQAERSVT